MLDRLRSDKAVGFLFSGGSARSVFQVGVVETLTELGVVPVACLGVSAGVWSAAAVSAGSAASLRQYWRFFCRMPYVDLTNLAREHSPFIWPRLHDRAFRRYIGVEKIRTGLPLYAALTRLRDRTQVIMDVREAADPFEVLLASNYLPPFYTHARVMAGERYGDGGLTDNVPYEALFERGCDLVVMIVAKGESEGGLHRNFADCDHVIPEQYRDRVILIQPRHRLPIGFVERRWERLAPIAEMGRLRAREVLLGERHPETDVAAKGRAPTAYVSWMFAAMRRRSEVSARRRIAEERDRG
ncbi:MAG: patatin-like phospholipase family protein [Acidobacteriota bacterium]